MSFADYDTNTINLNFAIYVKQQAIKACLHFNERLIITRQFGVFCSQIVDREYDNYWVS
jgi:hypothetical protein